MATSNRFDETISKWLEEAAPPRLPDRVLDATFERTRRSKQQVGWRAMLGKLRIRRVVPAIGSAAVVVVAAALALGLYANQLGVSGPATPLPPDSTPSPTTSPRPVPVSVPLEAGIYLYDDRQFTTVPFQFTVPDGWAAQNGGWNVMKNVDQADELGFASSILEHINADACAEETELVDAGSTVNDLVKALLDQSGPVVEGPFGVTLGGFPGQRLDLTAPPGADLADCNVPGGLQLWRDQADIPVVVVVEMRRSIYVVDVNGVRFVLSTEYRDASTAGDIVELRAVTESIQFTP